MRTLTHYNFIQLEVLKQNEPSHMHIQIPQYLNTCRICFQANAINGVGHLYILELCLNRQSIGHSTRSNVSKMLFLVDFT